jgi:hypothetical protein
MTVTVLPLATMTLVGLPTLLATRAEPNVVALGLNATTAFSAEVGTIFGSQLAGLLQVPLATFQFTSPARAGAETTPTSAAAADAAAAAARNPRRRRFLSR